MTVTHGHRNNFDLIRLLFAVIVFGFHMHLLVGSAVPPLFYALSFFPAPLAVRAFFVVSGYLVWQSFERSGSVREFAIKRARRLYPAFAVVVVLGGVLVAAASGHLRVLASLEGLRYFVTHLASLNFLYPNLTGVNVGNPEAQINGALWSIKVEIGCYVLLPLIALWARRVGWWPAFVTVYVVSVLWAALPWWHLGHQTPGQMGYFMSGATVYRYREWLAARWRFLVPAAVLLFAMSVAWPPLRQSLQPISLAVLIAYGANGLPYLGNFSRFGDLSYAIYLVHWPILQALVQMGAFAHPHQGALLATALVIASSMLCWTYIEKPFLRRDSHYVTQATSPAL